jgi:hypothetical protein
VVFGHDSFRRNDRMGFVGGGHRAMARAPGTISLDEYRAQSAVPKQRKYRNTPTRYKSIQGFERNYDSKKEAAFAAKLDGEISLRLVSWWLPQVSIPLPGGVIYRADFQVCDSGGRVGFIDVKGRDTQASKNKRKQVFALYGITVELA